MRVLFIGGTGVISSACAELAIERGAELYLLNRGASLRPVAEGAHVMRADIRNPDSVRAAIGDLEFDVVVDWIAFDPEHVETDLDLFRGRTAQYVFISSASVYQTPPARLPVIESTPLDNPYWQYARDKIACEQRLVRAQQEEGFPVTIVRPAHTYDRTKLPIRGSYTMVDRMRRGAPVVIHGDGTSVWALLHHTDFARGFVGLLGDARAIGEAFHITSEELLTWNQIFATVAAAAGAQVHAVHVPSEWIAGFDPEWGASLLGDKAHSMIFDNSKLRSIVPDFAPAVSFAEGAAESLSWFDAEASRREVDPRFDRVLDEIVAASAAPRGFTAKNAKPVERGRR